MSKKLVWGIVTVVLMIAVGARVYWWQHSKVINLNTQVSQLKASQASLTKQVAQATQSLNAANATVKSLTQTKQFQAGAACQTEQLTLSEEGSTGAAAGNRYQTWSYKNTSNVPCHVMATRAF